MARTTRPQIDLNLLRVFDTVMETRSASRAAEVLGVSQSAVSHALARLRDITNDPLFIREAGRLAPTSRAERLAEPLRDALDAALRALHAQEQFDPNRDRRGFTVACSDLVETMVLRRVIREIALSHSRLSLRVAAVDRDAALDALDSGEADLTIGWHPTLRRWHQQTHLFFEQTVCVFDPTQLPLTPPITIEDFASAGHVLSTYRGLPVSVADTALASLGLTRRVVAVTRSLLATGELLLDAPLLALVPGRLGQLWARTTRLVTSPVPFNLPDIPVTMNWHRRTSHSPADLWLRARVAVAAEEIV